MQQQYKMHMDILFQLFLLGLIIKYSISDL